MERDTFYKNIPNTNLNYFESWLVCNILGGSAIHYLPGFTIKSLKVSKWKEKDIFDNIDFIIEKLKEDHSYLRDVGVYEKNPIMFAHGITNVLFGIQMDKLLQVVPDNAWQKLHCLTVEFYYQLLTSNDKGRETIMVTYLTKLIDLDTNSPVNKDLIFDLLVRSKPSN